MKGEARVGSRRLYACARELGIMNEEVRKK